MASDVDVTGATGVGRERILFWIALVDVVVLDFFTKMKAEAALMRTPISVIGEWVQLRLVHNRGAAFGISVGEHSRWFFLAVALIAVGLLVHMSRSMPAGHRFRQVVVGMLAGGAMGNLIDRIRSARGVVDFIDVGIGMHRWPTFNVADMAVSCGALALAISLWREDSRTGPRAESGAASETESASAP